VSRKPDYKLKARDGYSDKWCEIGAGWANKDGSISIRLNYCVNIDSTVEPVLFPYSPSEPGDSIPRSSAKPAKGKRSKGVGS
jgi:hypothetical protein